MNLNDISDNATNILIAPVATTTSSLNFEVFLPVVFVLAFLLFLFLVYMLKNVDMRRKCCRLFYKKKSKPYPIMHPLRSSVHSTGGKRFNEAPSSASVNLYNYAKTVDLKGNNYYEDTSTGFYRTQNPYVPPPIRNKFFAHPNMHHANIHHDHNNNHTLLGK